MAHNLFCRCKKCNPSIMDMLFPGTSPKKSGFKKNLSNGTTIYGPKGGDKKSGNKHGHTGAGFHRTPHNSLGAASLGRSHNAKGHKTNRW